MTTPHRATPEQWAYMHERTEAGLEMTSCILELRDTIRALCKARNDLLVCSTEQNQRIEALEAAQLEQAESHRFCTDAIVRRVEALEAYDKEDANCWAMVRSGMHALRERIEALEAAQQDKLDRLIALDAADPTPDPAMAELRAASAGAQPEPQEEAGEVADWLHDHALSCRELGRNDWAAQSTRAATLLQQLSAIENLKTTNWKARCAELADRLDDALTYTVQSDTERSMRQLITRTRTALAQPEPEGPPMSVPGDAEGLAEVFWGRYDQPEPEVDEGIDDLVAWLWSMRDLAGECNPDEQRRYGLAATLLGQKAAETTHWRPATLAQPEPEDPTNKQAQELFQALRVPIYATRSPGMAEQIVGHEPVNPGDFARAVLTRFARPTTEPVPDTKAHELLNLLLDDLDALVDNSEGVAGLHPNGDVASWESLREGGRFEAWLMRMDEARAFLDSTMDRPDDIATTIEPVPVSEPEGAGVSDEDDMPRLLRRLIGAMIDYMCLPGHVITRDEWEKACLQSGRYCEPFLSGPRSLQPMPVAERPWEREGWCDAEGRCWYFFADSFVGGCGWQMFSDREAKMLDALYFCLPYYALPMPGSEVGL
jgi:hypothetical protein